MAHPGGPFFRRKDDGVWTIPKGRPAPDEELPAAAAREFTEEIGLPVGEPLVPLGEIRQRGGKVVHAWAFEGDLPAGFIPHSNSFEVEWPPRSGRRQLFPEVDRAAFFSVEEARRKLIAAQMPLVERLAALLGEDRPAGTTSDAREIASSSGHEGASHRDSDHDLDNT